jgi:hypothetical protein
MSSMSLTSPSISLRPRTYDTQKLAPIGLFVYNRPEHTQRTVDSLRENELALQSDLFVFTDGAKNNGKTDSAVQEVREFVHRIDGFRSVTIIQREWNFGLSRSVIAGVTQLCETSGCAIAVEDDMLTSRDFLTFMNRAFVRYADEPRVLSVSGFNFALKPPAYYRYDAFCSYRSSSWGWGTWSDRWQSVDWSVSDYGAFHADKTRQRMFNRGGEDLSRMLDLQMAGKIDSWAIRWAYTHFKRGSVALLPTAAKVRNIGLDRSGVHSGAGSARQSELVTGRNSEYCFPDSLELDPYFVTEIQRMCRPSLPRKFARHFLDKLRPQAFA